MEQDATPASSELDESPAPEGEWSEAVEAGPTDHLKKRLEPLESSYDFRAGRCGVFDGETTCSLERGHREGEGATLHRFYDPDGTGKWVEKDDHGVAHRRGGGRGWQGGREPAFDWPTIKARYVEGVKDEETGLVTWPSLTTVAAEFGVSRGRVQEKSALEGWTSARAQYQAQVEKARQAARAAELAKEAVGLDGKALDASKMGLQLCIAKLGEIGQAAQRARSDNIGTGGGSGGVIDALEQQRLAAAVDMWHRIGLRAIGDPETHRLEITGANGRPLDIGVELRRDDPNRLASVLAVLQAAGIGDLVGGPDDARRTLADARRADGAVAALGADD